MEINGHQTQHYVQRFTNNNRTMNLLVLCDQQFVKMIAVDCHVIHYLKSIDVYPLSKYLLSQWGTQPLFLLF